MSKPLKQLTQLIDELEPFVFPFATLCLDIADRFIVVSEPPDLVERHSGAVAVAGIVSDRPATGRGGGETIREVVFDAPKIVHTIPIYVDQDVTLESFVIGNHYGRHHAKQRWLLNWARFLEDEFCLARQPQYMLWLKVHFGSRFFTVCSKNLYFTPLA